MSDDRSNIPDRPSKPGDAADLPAMPQHATSGGQSKAAAKQERLAAQLRENLKKRKALRRARQTGGDNT